MKVSIILPVYNVEPYLEDCLKSIVSQSFQDWECICVNDGSTDGSLAILQRWAERDSRFRIISQVNGGLAAARSAGAAAARFEIISFVDSDDQLKPDYLAKLVRRIEKYDLDVCGCSYETFPNGSCKKFEFATDRVMNFEELMRSSRSIQKSNDLCFVWRYMIKRDFLVKNNIHFDKRVRIGEDMIYMTEVMAHAQRIMLTDEPLYLYRVNNPNSLMHESYNPQREPSLSLMHDIKLHQIAEYHIDDYTPYTQCLAEYTILQYLPMLIRNRLANNEDKKASIKAVLSLPMAKHAFKVVGFRNIYPSWKEYVYYLSLKFGLIRLAARYV